MKKIRLNVEDLAVSTVEMNEGAESVGTVLAASDTRSYDSFCVPDYTLNCG